MTIPAVICALLQRVSPPHPSEAMPKKRPKNEASGTSTASPIISRTVTTRSTVEVWRGRSSYGSGWVMQAKLALRAPQPEGQPVDQRAPRGLDDVGADTDGHPRRL